MAENRFVIGADYGTNSARFVLVNGRTGSIVTEHVYSYRGGEDGILLDHSRPLYAKQDPKEYKAAFHACMKSVLDRAEKVRGFKRANVVGIGVDTTGSTPIPVDKNLEPVGPAWLWKDKTSAAVAKAFNELAAVWEKKGKPNFTKYTGGLTSAEWILSKAIQLALEDPDQFSTIASFVEHCDYMPAWTVGQTDPRRIARSRCAAGHKAHFHEEWGGVPSTEFFVELGRRVGITDNRLESLADKLYTSDRVMTSDKNAGYLKKELAAQYGLSDKVAVAVGAFDAHMGAVGTGISPGILSKIMGTSTCDILVGSAADEKLVKGICGQVPGSVIPGMVGYEAGQSSAGDTFRWFRNLILRAQERVDDRSELAATERAKTAVYHYLEKNAAKYGPQDVAIVATDYFNGVRTPDVDPDARGMLLGLTLEHRPGHVYRALIEAVAFGARAIMDRITQYGVPINAVIACGGLTKSELVMQIHADVTGRPFKVSNVQHTCALGAAMFAAVAAGLYSRVEAAQDAMNPMAARFSKVYQPDMAAHAQYADKFEKYQRTRSIKL